MVEDNLRRGLMITAGDPSPFFTRPVSLIIGLTPIASMIWSTSAGQ
jgi:putative tricarboxylic transport membrane protein